MNQWLFKWHQLSGHQHPVEIDLFDGRTSHMGGIKFSGSARDVYWDAIARGVRKEIVDQFAWVDEQVRRYNRATAMQSIDECAGLIASFAAVIRRAAVRKDRILRGDGITFPSEDDAGHWYGTSLKEIAGQAEALKLSLPIEDATVPNLPNAKTWRGTWNKSWQDNQWWAGPIGLLVGLAGLLAIFI